MLHTALTVALAAAAPAKAGPANAGPPKPYTLVTQAEGITEYALPNGLHVLFAPDEGQPTVTVNVTYLVGSRHEGYGEKGMAHLLEHLLFKGTAKQKDSKKALSEHGAQANGTTWFDRTNYFEILNANDENLKWALEFEADRMVNSRIAKADLDAEMTVVRNEFEMGENSPEGVLSDRLMASAYLWHNYGDSTIGPRSDIERVPIENLQDFYRRHYQPDNAIVIVAGKFDEAKTFKWIADSFGKIPKPKRKLVPTYTSEPVQDGERAVTVRRVGGTPLYMAGYHVPAATDPDFPAVLVLAQAIGDSPSGTLYKALVEPKKAAEVGCFPFQLKDPGYLLCMAKLGPKDALEPARTAMLDTLEKGKPITPEQTERAKTVLLKGIELTLNSAERVGIQLSEWAATGDWRMLFFQRDRLKTVTAEDVNRVAGRYLKATNRTLGEYVPTEKPDRAEVPDAPDVAKMLERWQPSEGLAKGEAFDASPKNIDARTKTEALPNGMRVALLQKKSRGETVQLSLALRYGTEKTLTGSRAAGDFTAKMLSRGTKKKTREQFNDALDKLNVQLHIEAQPNVLLVTFEARKAQVAEALALVAEALREPAFDAKELETLKREVLAEAETKKSDPVALGFMALQRSMAPWPKGHPFAVPTFEDIIADATAMKVETVKDFHGRFYGTQDAQVAVVGDFDAEAVTKQLGELFGGWKAKEPYVRIPRAYREVKPDATTLDTPDKENAFMGLGVNFPMKDSDPDYAALVLADYMLGGGFMAGRLPQRLREKEGLSYGVGTMMNAPPLDDGAVLMGYAIYAPQNQAKIEAGFKEELTKAVASGFTADELKLARSGILKEREQERANDAKLARELMQNLFIGRTMQFEQEVDDRIAKLDNKAIGAALKKYVDPTKLVMIKAGDFKKVAAPK
ncbi:MAG: insulinase family protein [Myxococcaceae bacterium]|nr:insulinase family protein [Myxococcaceae bacterium]